MPDAKTALKITLEILKKSVGNVQPATAATIRMCQDLVTVIRRLGVVCSVFTTLLAPIVSNVNQDSMGMHWRRTARIACAMFWVQTLQRALVTIELDSVPVCLMSLDSSATGARRTIGGLLVDKDAIYASVMLLEVSQTSE